MATQTSLTLTNGAGAIDESIRRASILADVDTPGMVAIGTMVERGSIDWTHNDVYVHGQTPSTPKSITLTDGDTSLKEVGVTENIRNVMEFTPKESPVSFPNQLRGGMVGDQGLFNQQRNFNEGRIYRDIEARLHGNQPSVKPSGNTAGKAGSLATFAGSVYSNWSAGTGFGEYADHAGYDSSNMLSTKINDNVPGGTGTKVRQNLSVATVQDLCTRIKQKSGQSVRGREGKYGTTEARYIMLLPEHVLNSLVVTGQNAISDINRISSRMQGFGSKGGKIQVQVTMLKGRSMTIMLIGNTQFTGADDATVTTANAPKNQIGTAVLTGATSVVFASMPVSERTRVGAVNVITLTNCVWSLKGPLGDLCTATVGLKQVAV